MMEEIVAIASVVPVLLSLVALITTVFSLRERAKAESEFVSELSKMIIQMKVDLPVRQASIVAGSHADPDATLIINADVISRKEGSIKESGIRYSLGESEDSELREKFYHIYFSGVKGRGGNKELPDYVKKALANLDKRNRDYIVKALNQPSVKGRMRYFDKVLKMALGLVY